MASTSATSRARGKASEVRAHMTDLARELGKLGAWVRLHYVYPYPHVDNVIPLMAEGLVLPYLDIPFQHASPKVLRAMRRPANDAKVLAAHPQLARAGARPRDPLDLRRRLPRRDRGGLRLSARLARGSAARPRRRVQVRSRSKARPRRRMDDQVPEDVKQERYEAVMALSARISAEKLAAKVGTTIDVLIDAVDRGDRRRHRPLQGRRARDRRRGPPARRRRAQARRHRRRSRVEDSDEHDLYGVPA